MSDTPEVDAFLRAENCNRDNPVAFDWLVGLASSFERRLAVPQANAHTQGWNEALEKVAGFYDGCSCPEPCDDYGGGVNMGCKRGIADMIRTLKRSTGD